MAADLTRVPPDNSLAAAWTAFDRADWPVASRQFAANLRKDPAVAAEAAFGLAHSLACAQDYDNARTPLLQALSRAVTDVGVPHALAQTWTPRSGRGQAIDITKLKFTPTSELVVPLQVLALIYETAGDIAGAILVCHALWGFGVQDPGLFVKMGRLWMIARNNTEAARFFRKALSKGENLAALDGLADVAWLEGDITTVRNLLSRRAAASENPAERAAATFKAATVQPVIAADDTEIYAARSRFADALAKGPEAQFPDPWQLALGPNFYVNYQGRDERALQEAAVAYFRAATPGLAMRAPHVDQPRTGGKIRLGMVSNYFNAHTIGYLNRGLILGIDRDKFEVVLFRTPRAYFDAVTHEFAASAPIVDLPADLAAARRIIADAALDVLHYPEIGMDYFSYFLAFARLAKVQTVGWGHPVTTGIPNVDLFLSVADMEPERSDLHYSERLVRMKSLSIDVTRPMLAGAPSPRSALGLDEAYPAYVCAQSLYKVHHSFDAIIALILEHDPDARVYFISHGPHADQLFMTRLARRAGDNAARIRILPRISSEAFLHLLKAADVLLDVPQWSGGKTSLEGLSMGTPIVHCPGRFMRGRHTLAFYRRMGVTGTVVETEVKYAETAINLVHDRAFRAEIREQIAATSDRLFGDREAVRETERVWLDALGSPQ